jgi:hypothetical protein
VFADWDSKLPSPDEIKKFSHQSTPRIKTVADVPAAARL